MLKALLDYSFEHNIINEYERKNWNGLSQDRRDILLMDLFNHMSKELARLNKEIESGFIPAKKEKKKLKRLKEILLGIWQYNWK